MNWKLILQLSMFGLAIGIATVFVIPSNIEPFFWLPIFIICAYLIAKQAGGRYIWHGLALGLVNCLWITASHIAFADRYLANHASEAQMMQSMPMPDSPRLMMAMFGPVIGVISGIVIGILAWIAARIFRGGIATAPRG